MHAAHPFPARLGRWADPRVDGNVGVTQGAHVRAILVDACLYLISSAALWSSGVRVRLRDSVRDPDQVTGYAVALDHRPGRPETWFSGGKLAADLREPAITETKQSRTSGAARRAILVADCQALALTE